MAWWTLPTEFNSGEGINSTSDFFLNYPKEALGSGLYSNFIIIGIFLFMFIITLPLGGSAALAITGFIMSILSVYLFLNGFVGISYVVIFFVLTAIGVILSRGKK